MPDEEKEQEETEAAEPKKKSPIIMIAVIALVGIALAGGISFFVATQMMGGGGGGGNEDDFGDIRNHNPGAFVKLGDPKEGIIVNVGGGRSSKFLKASIVLEMNPNKKDIMTETGSLLPVAETKILDTTMQFLRASKIEDLDATKQDDLKKRLKDLLNSELGSGAVFDIYITSFLLQ